MVILKQTPVAFSAWVVSCEMLYNCHISYGARIMRIFGFLKCLMMLVDLCFKVSKHNQVISTKHFFAFSLSFSLFVFLFSFLWLHFTFWASSGLGLRVSLGCFFSDDSQSKRSSFTWAGPGHSNEKASRLVRMENDCVKHEYDWFWCLKWNKCCKFISGEKERSIKMIRSQIHSRN